MGRGIDWLHVADLGDVADKVIAARLGTSQQSVARARQRLGIPSLRVGDKDVRDSQIVDLLHAGWTRIEVARALRCGQRVVRAVAVAVGAPVDPAASWTVRRFR